MPSGSVGSLPVNASSPVGVPLPPPVVPFGVPAGVVGVVAGAVGVGVGLVVAAGCTVIVTVCVSSGVVPFDAVIVTVDVPGVVGVPEMTPVLPSMLNRWAVRWR